MKDITYNKDILDLIKKLSKLTKQFVISKEDDNVAIKVNCEKSVFVELTTPKANFDFDGESIAFVEGSYNKFYDFFSSYKKPVLKQDQNKLVIVDGTSSIKYLLSDPAIIKNTFKGTRKLPEATVTFALTKEQFSKIKDMIHMINTENVVFKASGDKVVISVVNEVTNNSFNLEIPLEKETKEILEVPLKSTIFDNAPDLAYEINIIQNLFHFKSVNEQFTLNLYTGMKSGK